MSSVPDLPRNARAARPPAEAAGDHQVDDEEALAFEREDDALPDPPHADDARAGDRVERRIDRPE